MIIRTVNRFRIYPLLKYRSITCTPTRLKYIQPPQLSIEYAEDFSIVNNAVAKDPKQKLESREMIDFISDMLHLRGSYIGTSMDDIMEILAGIDEVSLMQHVDKSHLTCFLSLKNANDIQQMSRTRLIQVLHYAKVPQDLFTWLQTKDLQILVRNVMLVAVEKMSHREMANYLSYLGWNTMQPYKDQLREALRLWVQFPEFPLLKASTTNHKFFTKQINDKFIENLHLFYEYEILKMSRRQLVEELQLRHQDSSGEVGLLRERLLAFQEFLIMRVMNEFELKTFLGRHYQKFANVTSPVMRKRLIQHLKHPNYSRFLTVSGSTARVSQDQSKYSMEEVFRKSYTEARRIMKRTYLNNPNVTDHAITSNALETLIPRQVSVSREVLYDVIPIMSRVCLESYWTYEKDMAMRKDKPCIWAYVSCVASYHYGIDKRPQFWEKYWENLRMKESNSTKIDADVLTTAKSIQQSHQDKFVSHSEIDNLPADTVNEILYSMGKDFLPMNHRSNKEMLKRMQERRLRAMNNRDVLHQILNDFCWERPISSRLKLSIKRLLADPFDVDVPRKSPPSENDHIYKISNVLSGMLMEGMTLKSEHTSFEVNMRRVLIDIMTGSEEYQLALPANKWAFISNVLQKRYKLNASRSLLEFVLRNNLPWMSVRSKYWFERQSDKHLEHFYASVMNAGPEVSLSSNEIVQKLVDFQDSFIYSRLDEFSASQMALLVGVRPIGGKSVKDTLVEWSHDPLFVVNQTLNVLDSSASTSSSSSSSLPPSSLGKWSKEEDAHLMVVVKSLPLLISNYPSGPEGRVIPSNQATESSISDTEWNIVAHYLYTMFGVEGKSPEMCMDRYLALKESNGDRRVANSITKSTEIKQFRRKRPPTYRAKMTTNDGNNSDGGFGRINSPKLPNSMSLVGNTSTLQSGNEPLKDIWERLKSIS